MKSLSPEMLLVASLAIAAVPLLIAVGTCYLKFSIVLSLLKSGFGTQQAPSAALVMALSVVMSLVVMQPVVSATAERVSAVSFEGSTLANLPRLQEKARTISEPWKTFLLEHSGERELSVFSALTQPTKQKTNPTSTASQTIEPVQVAMTTALAAFVLSEIKRGFTLGFFLLVPFFVIDIVVANLLVALGLTMMSPVVVSLPIKLLLFISTDGWLVLARNLIQAYQ